MMDEKHMPGSWECIGFEFITDEEEKTELGEHVFKAVIRRHSGSTMVSIMDAHLISAAPELLDACQLAFWTATNPPTDEGWRNMIDALRAAIAKAEGENNA